MLKNNTKVYLTQKSADLHSLIGESILSQSRKPNKQARTDSRKNVMKNVDLVTNHRHVESSHLAMMEKAMHDVTTKIINDMRKKHGENEQGEKNNNVKLDKAVWAADTSPIGPVKKRKKMNLDKIKCVSSIRIHLIVGYTFHNVYICVIAFWMETIDCEHLIDSLFIQN